MDTVPRVEDSLVYELTWGEKDGPHLTYRAYLITKGTKQSKKGQIEVFNVINEKEYFISTFSTLLEAINFIQN